MTVSFFLLQAAAVECKQAVHVHSLAVAAENILQAVECIFCLNCFLRLQN